MIIKRNLLCIKKKENIDLGHRLLYEPYKNILNELVKLCIKKEAKDFDPGSKVFDGLESIPEDEKYYYESLLGVTSYYQHSQGGRGTYIQKKISSIMNTCVCGIKISEFPLWLSHPNLYWKKGIFTKKGLTKDEEEKLKTEWVFTGINDETTDLASFLKDENTIVLEEIKNRADSGGVAARREIWTSKFIRLLDIIKNDKLYRKGECYYSFTDFLKSFDINKMEIYIGILFNVDGTPATKQGDKKGFHSSNKEGFRDLKNAILNKGIEISSEDSENLEIDIKIGDFTVKFGALYGDEISSRLFRKDYSVSELLILKYDDMWLSQLTAISERGFLLKFDKNYMTAFKELLKEDSKIRELYNDLIDKEGTEDSLKGLIEYLLEKYNEKFPMEYCPSEKERDEYLADVIQVLTCAEA